MAPRSVLPRLSDPGGAETDVPHSRLKRSHLAALRACPRRACSAISSMEQSEAGGNNGKGYFAGQLLGTAAAVRHESAPSRTVA
eukprot:CAMPEP_0172915522 /NCGR_PEP_ID=MMETSP1075-20121228/194458_1 /TAXON_ID=2916 /ORGANISM="Ceratium fusus, Strain PA161109" /LENGTH=83 /DNA_ID=CAMNT_0013774615 /DNA_START=133 /DNA_END=384 /DNA_ORIENTATION=-